MIIVRTILGSQDLTVVRCI